MNHKRPPQKPFPNDAPVPSDVSIGDRMGLAFGQLGGAAASIGLQLLVMGSIGPIATVIGVCLGGALFFARQGHVRPGWLTRPRLFKLAAGSLVQLGLLGGALYLELIFHSPQSMGNLIEHPYKASAVFALLCAVVGGISTVIVGDLFAWRRGGYTGEDIS